MRASCCCHSAAILMCCQAQQAGRHGRRVGCSKMRWRAGLSLSASQTGAHPAAEGFLAVQHAACWQSPLQLRWLQQRAAWPPCVLCPAAARALSRPWSLSGNKRSQHAARCTAPGVQVASVQAAIALLQHAQAAVAVLPMPRAWASWSGNPQADHVEAAPAGRSGGPGADARPAYARLTQLPREHDKQPAQAAACNGSCPWAPPACSAAGG